MTKDNLFILLIFLAFGLAWPRRGYKWHKIQERFATGWMFNGEIFGCSAWYGSVGPVLAIFPITLRPPETVNVLGANKEGFYLHPVMLSMTFHCAFSQPVFIPWENITFRPAKLNLLGFKLTVFEFLPYKASLIVSSATANRLLRAAGKEPLP